MTILSIYIVASALSFGRLKSLPAATILGAIALSEHFHLEASTIQSLTDIGEVTARILGFNDSDSEAQSPRVDHLLERQLLMITNKYPHPAALKRMGE